MLGPQFHQTPMGMKYYTHILPELVRSIQELTRELKRYNDRSEPHRCSGSLSVLESDIKAALKRLRGDNIEIDKGNTAEDNQDVLGRESSNLSD